MLELRFDNVKASARLDAGLLRGSGTIGEREFTLEAERPRPRPPQPTIHDFEPSKFELYFTSTLKP
ncbi:MAG: hypothetical protein WKF37_23790, partial [Bryobacteraceae bacterium]